MDGQRTGKRREGVLLVLWQYPRGVLMHFSWRGSQSSHERGDAALCRRPSLTWKSLSKRGLTKRGVVFQGFLSKHWAQQNTLWFCLLEGKRWVSKESKKGSKQERKQARREASKQARCSHGHQLLFSRSFEWQGCPMLSRFSFALVGAGTHHADPSPAALPLSSVAGDIFGFGHSLLPFLTLGDLGLLFTLYPPSTSSMLSLPTRNQSTPCPPPLLLIPLKFPFKMRP